MAWPGRKIHHVKTESQTAVGMLDTAGGWTRREDVLLWRRRKYHWQAESSGPACIENSIKLFVCPETVTEMTRTVARLRGDRGTESA